jgi:tetratricopeptide (TPR) repeat protein
VKAAFLQRARAVRRALLLALVTGVPVLFVRANNDPVNVPKLSFLIAGVSLALCIRMAEWLQGNKPEGLLRLWVPAAAFIVPLTWGWLFSPYKGWALFGQYGRYQGLIPYIVIILLGALVADAFADDRHLPMLALLWAGAIVGAYAIVQVLDLDPIVWSQAGEEKRWAGSTLGNPNFTGGFLGIVLPLAAALIVEGRFRKLVLGLSVPIVVGWIVSFSQGGWAAGAAGVVAALGWIAATRWPRARVAGLAIALLIAGAALGDVVLGIVKPHHPLVPATVQLRSYAYQAAGEMTLDHPLTGRGPNAFAIEGVQYRTEEDARFIDYNFPDEPHNVMLALAAGAGVLGAIGFLVAAFWVLKRSISIPNEDVLAAAFFGAIVAYFVQSLVSIDELSLRVALWTALGGLAASFVSDRDEEGEEAPPESRRKKRKRAREPLSNPFGVGALAVVAAAAVWWAGSYALADARVWQGSVLAATGRIDDAQEQFDKARAFKDDEQFNNQYGLSIAEAALGAGDEGREDYELALEAFAYLEDFPHLPDLAEYARVLEAGAVYDPAFTQRSLDVYERMMELDPFNPVIRAEAADVLITLERPDEAYELIRAVVRGRVGRRNPEVWGTIALASALVGEEDQAERAARRALDIDPEEPRALRAREILAEGN